jgi:hypothetical protein
MVQRLRESTEEAAICKQLIIKPSCTREIDDYEQQPHNNRRSAALKTMMNKRRFLTETKPTVKPTTSKLTLDY